MKQLFLFLLVLVQMGAFAQTRSLARPSFEKKTGTARLQNWTPDKNTSSPQPTITSIVVKWEVEPGQNSCEVKMSMQWYLGNKVYYKGKEFSSPIITSREINNFSLITLQVGASLYEGSTYLGKIVFDMGKTPPAGGTWGSDILQKRNWSSVIQGKSEAEAKIILNKNYTLSKLTIEKIEFGGTQPFKNAAFEKFSQQAEQFESRHDYQKAIDFYGLAASLNTTRSAEASNKRGQLVGQLKKFYDYLEKGNDHYGDKEFYSAMSDYENALEIIPDNDKAEKRIAEIRTIISKFERIDQEAASILQNANEWRTLRQAEDKFREALSFMPVDKKEYIANRLAEVDRGLDREYNSFLMNGERAFQAKDYVAAAGALKEATLIFPDREEAKVKLKETEDVVLASINKKYSEKVSEAVHSRNELFENAAKTLDQNSEGCYVEQAVFYQCRVDYYNGLRENAGEEMRAQLYSESYFVPRMECFQSGCQPLPPKQQGTADEYMAAAQRKDRLFQEYGNASFQQYRDEYLDRSIKLSPNNPAAYTFKAELALASIEKMEWLNKALAVDPQYQPALEAKNNIQGDFSSEVFERIEEGDLEYLRRAVKNNLLRNIATYQNYDVLEYAILKDQVPALDYLLQNKTRLHSITVSNIDELLYKSVGHRSSKSTDFLLASKGANVNYKKEGQDPLLVLATLNNDYENVQKLLAAGANIHQKGTGGKAALDLAIEKDFPPVVELLLSRYDRALPDDYIFMAIDNNSSPVLGHLLRKGARLDVKDRDGNTPLHVAVQKKYSGLSQTLVNSGAGVNTQNNSGETPLLLACKNGLSALAQILMEGRADIDVANDRSETPLYWAVKNNMTDLANMLFQRHARPAPALALAKQRNEQDLVENLAYRSALFGIENGREPLVELAVDYNSGIGFLEPAGKINLLRAAIQQDNLEAFDELLGNQEERKTNVNGYSAMHLAVIEKNMRFTQHLLDKLTNTKAVDNEGASPLHRAIEAEFDEALNQLVHRFNIDGQDKDGKTPLHYAVEARNRNAVAILLQQGANKKIKDNRRWKPKKLARKKKFKTIKKML